MTTITLLMIGRLEYTLSPFEDVEALKAALLRAGEAGAGIVTFRATGDVDVSALITPGVTVLLEEREIGEQDPLSPSTDPRPGYGTDYDLF